MSRAVDRRKHQVPGHSRLHRGTSGLGIAHFADKHDVRILTQYRSQQRGESISLLLVHRDLRDAGQFYFDRVFDRDDVSFTGINASQRRVQRASLSAAGRAADEHHAAFAADRFVDGLEHPVGEIEVPQITWRVGCI